jgi:hypothetical protein
MRAISAREAIEELKTNDRLLSHAVVSGTLRISGHNLGGGPLFLDNLLIKGDLIIEDGEFECLSIDKATVEGVIRLRRVRLPNGMGIGATVEAGLDLTSVELGGVIDLAELRTPAIAIKDMEELEETIHRAAPTTPLITTRPRLGMDMLS